MTLQPALPVWLLLATAAVLIGVLVARRRRGGRGWLLIAAAGLLLVALLRPVIGGNDTSVTRVAGDTDPNVFLVVDRSTDMTGPRGEQARADVEALLDRHPDARFAMIGFGARPSLDWPLSADSWSLRPVVSSLGSTSTAPADTANAGAAGNVLRYQLISAVQQFPRARNLIYYLGAGAPESEVPQREFDLPERAVDGGAVLGYGDAGARGLQAVADQIGLPYVPRTEGQALPDAAVEDDEPAGQADSTPLASGVELYWIFAAAAAVLIIVELYQVLREVRRTRLDRVAVGR